MKKLMTIFGAFFFASVVLTSCGDVNIEDVDKDIESEEEAVEAMLTLGRAQIDLFESLKGPLQEIANLKDRAEEIEEASDDIMETIRDEDLDLEDIIEDDEMEDMLDEIEDLDEEIKDLMEDCYDLLRLYGGGRDDVYDRPNVKQDDRRERRGSGYRSSGAGSAASAAEASY